MHAGQLFNMTLSERLSAFQALGESLEAMTPDERTGLSARAESENGWFTKSSVSLAFKGLSFLLNRSALEEWANGYLREQGSSKSIGVATAGNIPLVGFHDFLCVLVAGHRLRYKPSTRDAVLPEFILSRLSGIEPRFAERIARTDRLNGVDAVIATGSNNTARYFEYYFRKVPHILRKNRVSCGIIQGNEPDEEISRLGADVFSYYGLGCRNVATLLVPNDFEVHRLTEGFRECDEVLDNHKYANNYIYQKSLLMLNREQFHDTGFLLIRESESLVSPVAVLHITRYHDLVDLKKKLAKHRDNLQAIVSANGWFEGSLPFGTAQFPNLTDYADGIDTMKFLMSIR